MSTPSGTATSEYLLVVDDNPIKRYTTARPLERAGFVVVQAENGTTALRLIQERRPSLVVLDVKLPDIDGFEVCRRIKENPETADLLVLHLSAHRTRGDDLAQGLEGGADAYLAVPVEATVLVATVRSLLRLHRAEEDARTAALYWRDTFDAISDAVLLVGTDGIVTQGNATAGALLNTVPEKLTGLSFRTFLEWLGIVEGMNHIVTNNGTGTAEVQLGDGRWMRVTVDALGTNPAVSGTVCTLSDITARVQIEQARAEAAAKHERIAETLQRSLLLTPGANAFPGLEVASLYKAAWKESLVGGDFSDVFAVDTERVGFVVGDVTGKGLAAALFTAEIKFVLRAFLREYPHPSRALYRLNHYLLDSRRLEPASPATEHDVTSHKFVSLVVAIIDTATGALTCAAAGAEPPMILRVASRETECVDAACGPLLAVEADSEFQDAERNIAPGDLLLLATDGITESRSPERKREFFGMEGMAQAAWNAFEGAAEEIAKAVVGAALQFAGGSQQDDICLLAVRRDKQPENRIDKKWDDL